MSDFELLDPGAAFGGAQPADGGDPLLDGLNPEQRRAVVARGPALLIVAGAGSGKTRVLTHRIAHLIREKEAWPSQILAITFTNKAAAEMRERLGGLLGSGVEGMWVSTFHSACVRILRREAERFGYVSGFTIYDSADSRALLKRIIKDLDADTYGFTPANTSAKISKLKNELSDATDYASTMNASDPRERLFTEIFTAYEQELKRANAFDFDDLIGQTVQLFRAHPDVAAIYKRRFRHILVDEYQDTNHAQYSLIRELTKSVEPEQLATLVPPVRERELDGLGRIPGASLTVVGDSDQSIYAFRGADIRNIVEFERDFSNAEVVKLEQNYRSTQNILSAANAVIGNNFDRQDKKLWTAEGDGDKIVGFTGYSQHDEARFVAEEIEDLHRDGMAYGDIAVFYRTNSQTRALEELLIRSAIPYRVLGGTKFYDRAEIKDAMAYLTTIANPFDPIAWSRMLGAPKRGVGPMAEAHLANFQEAEGVSFHQAMERAAEIPALGPKIRTTVVELADMLARATAMALGGGGTEVLPPVAEEADDETSDASRKKPAPVADVLKLVLDSTEMIEKLRAKRDPQDDARAENLEELLAVAREFDAQQPGAGLLAFLTEVSLVAAADDLDDQSGTVSLMTLHTAKGLEYPAVFITGVEEGLIPHQMSVDELGGINEERRLMYVGITRARQKLFITLASTRATFGDIAVAMPSRFLQEIPESLIEWRQSPGEVTGRGGTASRALNAGRAPGAGGSSGASWSRNRDSQVSFGAGGAGGSSAAVSEPASGNMQSALDKWRERKRLAKEAQAAGGGFPNTIVGNIRDNGDLELALGDRIRHDEYGEGRVNAVTGAGSKRVAHVTFDSVGERKLLVKLAPIEKLSE
ncbi:ATP-dependent helicase [Leucobacter aridicollis]|uniref:DNA 3'-5' helicase n=1 Tax=Leucobacter aridicollis TaxID=283878 RepID=A0A852R728_9MICO|nr:UvrD-helicase domain-containing protein [Leucobacter aridicollis]MBL3682791.1 ATP-dependent DNA helicase PcrA [Leucobacter aridicollis]NYD26229.1 DNA helicase-2/ATP-dependent DNA helicase PcrA [Leucobacter aridicollis]